ncbi:MAG: Fic family protein [Desulfobulbaceae bacterium]|nr:Fic family protein [Desulfobulbaceae bacterium]
MATPSEKLAESLQALKELQQEGRVAIQSSDLSRTHRERLLKNGFLQSVMKGWYIPSRPDEQKGESTSWYASYWSFCAAYLSMRFGKRWLLSSEQSLLIHTGNRTVPRQLLVKTEQGSNNIVQLPFNTSLLDIKGNLPATKNIEEKESLLIYKLPPALVECSPNFFLQRPTDARAALAMVRDASDVLEILLDGGHSTIAGRLAGAFRNIGRERIADDIIAGMKAAGYEVRESDPFDNKPPILLKSREQSAYVSRLRLMWHEMREPILTSFPTPTGIPSNIDSYIKNIEESYASDAYHSLSIEGYQVTPQLIERVHSGDWNPDQNSADQQDRNALAARGYWQANLAVRESIKKIMKGKNPGEVADQDHGLWYREMFSPSVTAGLLKPSDLAGYRNMSVYIRRSMHVPPSQETVRDAMPAFFDLLREESEPAVRAVLGHFVFVYIHPYMDGNGRIGRFLMNAMLASGGYRWTIIPVERRNEYMSSLEAASVDQNIKPFADFISSLLTKTGALVE